MLTTKRFLKNKMIGSDAVFGNGFSHLCQKISLNRGKSYIDSPD